MVHSPLLRYGTPELYNNVPDFNVPVFYAHVEKSTGLATLLDTQNSNPNPNPNIQTYGPYKSVAATATIFDMGLILYGNRHYYGNFRQLADCLLTVIQRETANGPPAEPLVLMAYGGCLMDALAAFITSNCNFVEGVRFWDLMVGTFISAAQSLQIDFDEHQLRHLDSLISLRNQVFRAYEEKTWPDEVWPEFEACVFGTPWIRSEDLVTFPQRPPACFRVLIGDMKQGEDEALPDVASNPNFFTNPNLASNPCPAELVKMYEMSSGGKLHRSMDQSTSEDRGFEGETEIKEREDEESRNECFKIPDCCRNCSGPSSVTYTFRWVCNKIDHTVDGWKEERHGPFTIMTPDCASRIHDEVRKIFGFATEFQGIRCNGSYLAPTFVAGSCFSHYRESQFVPMEYQIDWCPTEQDIPMALDGEEGDDEEGDDEM